MNIGCSKESSLPLPYSRINDPFWSSYMELVKQVVIPYQWEAINDRVADAEPSYAMRNFRIAAGEAEGGFGGMVFQDSDVYKWLEAVGHMLAVRPDPELEALADEAIRLIGLAQQPDGYINMYFTLKEPQGRWTNLAECHELYCAGHLFEAGVAYYNSTGKRAVLDICCRFADYIDSVFGAEPGKLKGYDGHQEIELALMKLYEATGEERYLRLSRFFLEERGQAPHFFHEEAAKRSWSVHFPELDMANDWLYNQSHLPVKEQSEAVGHAVRLVYMCTGMAHVAGVTGDEALLAACRRLWDSIVHKRMYITGAIGSMAMGEAFTTDYDLPNDTVYGETCASIGLIFFARRMLEAEAVSEYADVLERALYNTVLGGMAKDGKHFFYVNPLEVYPPAIQANKIYQHVKMERQKWFGCSCCPPNIARLIASIHDYVYSRREDTVYTHLYIGGEAGFEIGGRAVRLEQEADYLRSGRTRLTVRTGAPAGSGGLSFRLALRIPGWCGGQYRLLLNGVPLEGTVLEENGYAVISRMWQEGDVLEAVFQQEVLALSGHPMIRQVVDKVALQRGPLVYCMEEADNGGCHHLVKISRDKGFELNFTEDWLDGNPVIRAKGIRLEAGSGDDPLYSPGRVQDAREETFTFIPYYAWGNRGVGEMNVWVREWKP